MKYKIINSVKYKNSMNRLLKDSKYLDNCRKFGRIGAKRYHELYKSPSSTLCDELNDQIDWISSSVDINSVPHDSKLIINCFYCDKVMKLNYKTLKYYDSFWICISCRRRKKYLKGLENIDKEIIKLISSIGDKPIF